MRGIIKLNTMLKFIGTKEILAKPMTRLEYNKYRGWELPNDENGADEGYLVEYIDSPNSNHEDHKGYISWSPKEVFDKAYRLCGTHYERLLIEAQDLAIKVNKLNDFMRTQGFIDLDRIDKDLLYEQSRAMSIYLQILGKRIEVLGDKFSHKD